MRKTIELRIETRYTVEVDEYVDTDEVVALFETTEDPTDVDLSDLGEDAEIQHSGDNSEVTLLGVEY